MSMKASERTHQVARYFREQPNANVSFVATVFGVSVGWAYAIRRCVKRHGELKVEVYRGSTLDGEYPRLYTG